MGRKKGTKRSASRARLPSKEREVVRPAGVDRETRAQARAMLNLTSSVNNMDPDAIEKDLDTHSVVSGDRESETHEASEDVSDEIEEPPSFRRDRVVSADVHQSTPGNSTATDSGNAVLNNNRGVTQSVHQNIQSIQSPADVQQVGVVGVDVASQRRIRNHGNSVIEGRSANGSVVRSSDSLTVLCDASRVDGGNNSQTVGNTVSRSAVNRGSTVNRGEIGASNQITIGQGQSQSIGIRDSHSTEPVSAAFGTAGQRPGCSGTSSVQNGGAQQQFTQQASTPRMMPPAAGSAAVGE